MTASFDIDALLGRLDGDVVVAEDEGWDAARAAWNLVADLRPAAVVLADNADDVAVTVRFAREHGLRVAPTGPGHGAPQLPALDDVLLLRTTRMNGVEVDPDARTARAQAGALWGDVVPLAAEHGLAALHGSSGTVGVVGYTLGGGIGWLGRKFGFASSAVTRLDVVTADGEAHTVTADSEPDLFWALRGGGGAYALVTAIEFGLVPLREVYAGQLMWPMDQAPEIVDAYREWTAGAPDDLAPTIKLMRFPPIPDIPEPLRGRELVGVGVAALGDEALGRDLVAPMRDVAPRYLDTVQTIPAAGLAMIAGDPPGPVPGVGTGNLLDALPAEATQAYLELGGPGATTPLLQLELRQFGGALAQSAPEHGAADTTEGFGLYGVGIPISPEVGQAISAFLAEIKERMAAWAAPETQVNFAEAQPEIRGSFPGPVADRLESIKTQHDPDGVIVGNHG
ncbi:MAG TPA: FAD-dependent oxidoreductase, partial [Solirubrobacteraceae bacterium]